MVGIGVEGGAPQQAMKKREESNKRAGIDLDLYGKGDPPSLIALLKIDTSLSKSNSISTTNKDFRWVGK